MVALIFRCLLKQLWLKVTEGLVLQELNLRKEIEALYSGQLILRTLEVKSRHQRVEVECSKGHSFTTSAKSLLDGRGCRDCLLSEQDLTVFGHTFRSMKELAIYPGVPLNLLQYRIKKLGFSVEEAASLRMKNSRMKSSFDDWKQLEDFESSITTDESPSQPLSSWIEDNISKASADEWSTTNTTRLKEMVQAGFLLEQIRTEFGFRLPDVVSKMNSLGLLEEYLIKNIEYGFSLTGNQDIANSAEFSAKNETDLSGKDVLRIIHNHESKTVELKSSFSTCLKNAAPPDKLRESTLKAVAGFMNSVGGTIFIGVKDNKEIIGIERDGFNGDGDAYIRLINDKVKSHMSGFANTLIAIEIIQVKGKNVCAICVKKSPKPVYYKPSPKNDEEHFYVRSDRQTNRLIMSDAHTYIKQHFDEE